MAWTLLLVSGVFEAVWAIALSRSERFTKLVPSVVFLVASVISLVGLGIAMRDLPTGTSYAVWTATGATITVLYSFVTGEDRATLGKALLLLTLVASVVGLKLVS